jgi:nitrogen fixation protein NifU and related proteins
MDFTFLSSVPWSSALAGAIVIFVVIGGWTLFMHKTDPERGTLDSPDASAFLRGSCGDAMKISLRFFNERVVEAKYWTDGCRMSSACGSAAAKLALHKTPEEIADIDYLAIEKEAGALPEEDRHCATLAAGTLQEALRLYFAGNSGDVSDKERSAAGTTLRPPSK